MAKSETSTEARSCTSKPVEAETSSVRVIPKPPGELEATHRGTEVGNIVKYEDLWNILYAKDMKLDESRTTVLTERERKTL